MMVVDVREFPVQVAVDRDRFAGWINADNEGSDHHTVNSSIADKTVTVSGSTIGEHRLTSLGTAAYIDLTITGTTLEFFWFPRCYGAGWISQLAGT